MIPQSFEEWQLCITQGCGIALTPEFAAARLAVYKQQDHAETVEFIKKYGYDHYQRILSYFELICLSQ